MRYLGQLKLSGFSQGSDGRLGVFGLRVFSTKIARLRLFFQIWDSSDGSVAWEGMDELEYAEDTPLERTVTLKKVIEKAASDLIDRLPSGPPSEPDQNGSTVRTAKKSLQANQDLGPSGFRLRDAPLSAVLTACRSAAHPAPALQLTLQIPEPHPIGSRRKLCLFGPGCGVGKPEVRPSGLEDALQILETALRQPGEAPDAACGQQPGDLGADPLDLRQIVLRFAFSGARPAAR